MTAPDRHKGHTIPIRVADDYWPLLQQASLDHEVSVNWIVNRAIRMGLPAVLKSLEAIKP